MAEGRFREDLYYRLNVVSVAIPPLREREGDITLLAKAFLQRQAARHQKSLVFTPKALQVIESHGWPGNVRELENRIQRAAIMAENGRITHQDLGLSSASTEYMGQSLGKAREAVERQMIEAALEFIREQHRKGVRERLDLRLLVESVVDDLADVGSEIELSDGPSAPFHGDPLALRRMVGNLVDNALKYGRRARLSLHAQADGYALHIDDDGPGVDASRSEHLFMPFVRGETSRNRETGGIGLGLATARSIALAHGGDIALRNRVEGGLRVMVTLPYAVSSPRGTPRLAIG